MTYLRTYIWCKTDKTDDEGGPISDNYEMQNYAQPEAQLDLLMDFWQNFVKVVKTATSIKVQGV